MRRYTPDIPKFKNPRTGRDFTRVTNAVRFRFLENVVRDRNKIISEYVEFIKKWELDYQEDQERATEMMRELGVVLDNDRGIVRGVLTDAIRWIEAGEIDAALSELRILLKASKPLKPEGDQSI